MTATKSLIADLEDAVRGGSLDRRVATMRRVTDLFLYSAGTGTLSEEQIGLFDNALMHIVKWVESNALEELSRRLAPVRNAPIGVIQHLARHDDIAVAGPVLSQSERLGTSDLIEIAKKKSQEHLLAISSRNKIGQAVTDVILGRGTNDVFCKLAQNAGASFSQAGVQTLINSAKNNEMLAERIGQRIDIPRHMIHELVSRATHAVRIKLLATAPPELHADIKALLVNISSDVIHKIGAQRPGPEGAKEFVLTLQREKRLKDPMLCELAKNGEVEKLTAALAEMASARIELIDRLMHTLHYGGLLVACKAADLQWDSVKIILTYRHRNHPIAESDLNHARTDYAELTKSTAIRLLGFWQAEAGVRSH